jgi:hypothetical protein
MLNPRLPGGEAGVVLEQQDTLGQQGHRGRSNLPTQQDIYEQKKWEKAQSSFSFYFLF